MLGIQHFVKNMEDKQIVDVTKESFLDIEISVREYYMNAGHL